MGEAVTLRNAIFGLNNRAPRLVRPSSADDGRARTAEILLRHIRVNAIAD